MLFGSHLFVERRGACGGFKFTGVWAYGGLVRVFRWVPLLGLIDFVGWDFCKTDRGLGSV